MLHNYVDDDPNGASHWALGRSTPAGGGPGAVLLQVAGRDANQVRVRLADSAVGDLLRLAELKTSINGRLVLETPMTTLDGRPCGAFAYEQARPRRKLSLILANEKDGHANVTLGPDEIDAFIERLARVSAKDAETKSP